MTEIKIIKKRQIEREHELSELMADFDEKALRHWIREFLLRHQSYKSSLKFDCSNLCLTWLIEDDMAQNMHLLEFGEFYDGMREAWKVAHEQKLVIPSYINNWFTSTIVPNHRPPVKRYGRKTYLFEHVICYCIYTTSKHSPFKASRNNKCAANSICDFVSDEIGLDFTTVKGIWVDRDRELFPKKTTLRRN